MGNVPRRKSSWPTPSGLPTKDVGNPLWVAPLAEGRSGMPTVTVGNPLGVSRHAVRLPPGGNGAA